MKPPTATVAPLASPSPTATPDPSELPPAGITATKKTLAQVLALYRASVGRPTRAFKTSREVDAVTAYGETGAYTELWSGNDYVDVTQLGPTTYSSGRLHGKRWRQNENGFTRIVSGIHTEDQTSSDALRRAIGGVELDSVALLGEVSAPVSAYVVEVHPFNGRHEWIFLEKSTGRIVRTEEGEIGRRVVWTFDDFRTTDGISSSWHQHVADGYAGNDMDWRITRLEYGTPVAASELAMPPSRRLVQFPPGVSDVRLPARIEDGAIIVRLYINGRGLDFALDSGSSEIILDRDVARQLGLKTFGQNTESVAGTFAASNAIIPEMRVGDLTLKNVVVDCLPFNQQVDFGTAVVGLLGYDFLAGITAKIDYDHGTLDAIDPSAFVAPRTESFQLPMRVDDEVPMVSATVGEDSGDAFIVDTGSVYVVIFDKFARENDLEQYTVDELRKTYYPMVTASGVGGLLYLVPVLAPAFHFASVNFQDFTVFEMAAKTFRSFQGEDTDGLIGYDFLRFFDVYIDYHDSAMIFVPNAILKRVSAVSRPSPSPQPSPAAH